MDEIAGLRHALQKVFVHEEIGRWIVTLVRATREIEMAAIGSSVRGTLALSRAARAWAILSGRDYVTPEDVEALFVPVLVHRIFFKPSFLAEARERGWNEASAEVRAAALARAPRPGLDLDLERPPATVA